jgi:hypothetical protein
MTTAFIEAAAEILAAHDPIGAQGVLFERLHDTAAKPPHDRHPTDCDEREQDGLRPE